MDQEGFVEELRAQASCPMCLEILRDPMTLACGHNCCESCLQQLWEGLLDVFPCPVCQHHCTPGGQRVNIQLRVLGDLLRQLPGTETRKRKRQAEGPWCPQHPQQVLSLFCEQDLELVCAQCGLSCEHSGHDLTTAPKAAAQHRQRLKAYLQPLKKQLADALRGLQLQGRETEVLSLQVQALKAELDSDLQESQQFLQRYLEVTDAQIFRAMEALYQTQESRDQLLAHSSSLQALQRELARTSLQTDTQLLLRGPEVRQLLKRCEDFKGPEASSFQSQEAGPSLPHHYMGTYSMITRFQTPVSLDPETAHCSLLVGGCSKMVLFPRDTEDTGCEAKATGFTSHMAILGSQTFESGRHFWVVKISGKGTWALGVCKASFPRHALQPPSPSLGCWHLEQHVDLGPDSAHSHANHDWESNSDSLRIGVFLDYELGELSLYHMQHRALIATIHDTFSDSLLPYFSARPESPTLSMKIITQKA
ncbi:tripartite motif-containing protein 75-like [Erinaceus europaeus]|uniref:Tripartite motif-containing protein 75-like n=1 Tax=Erinaceus europaeus TaxID=9365 RepID=A0ABM3X735_ERIEU|nr:tripartite motif-containing protein 75-like [Erinaceus europaeus]XP_060044620.1 tripartite motif-containing protein 75-like [Erinaceus europaeus]XP_060044621.1 tripartite motif-containing protein 75-like [Erinaceus europaeus]